MVVETGTKINELRQSTTNLKSPISEEDERRCRFFMQLIQGIGTSKLTKKGKQKDIQAWIKFFATYSFFGINVRDDMKNSKVLGEGKISSDLLVGKDTPKKVRDALNQAIERNRLQLQQQVGKRDKDTLDYVLFIRKYDKASTLSIHGTFETFCLLQVPHKSDKIRRRSNIRTKRKISCK